MEMLASNIEQMREYGISLGMGDVEIDECIYQSLKQSSVTSEKPPPDADDASSSVSEHNRGRGLCWGLCGRCVSLTKAVCVFAWFSLGLYYFICCHPPTHKYLTQVLHPLAYGAVRILRLSTLPLARNYDLSAIYEGNCLVPNPFFLGPPLECEPCEETKTIPQVSAIQPSDFLNDHIHLARPVLILDGLQPAQVTLKQLSTMYDTHTHKFAGGGTQVTSSDGSVTSLHQLMTDMTGVLRTVDVHIHWYTSKVGPSQALRTVFKRPYFIPNTTEILVEKSVYIDGPKAKPFSLTSQAPNLWYSQASGSRQLVLVPRANCAIHCQSLQVTMTTGQALFVPDIFWRVDSLPVTGAGSELSIAFVGNFI